MGLVMKRQDRLADASSTANTPPWLGVLASRVPPAAALLLLLASSWCPLLAS